MTDIPSDAFASGSSLPSAVNPPSEFICPISYEMMTDPVILSDGHTYERASIMAWLQTHNTSPLTNRPVNAADIKPNYALRSAIERYMASAPAVSKGSQLPVERIFNARTDGKHLFVECSNEEPLETVTILVNDVSGSMGEPSSKPGGSAKAEGSLFSRLDLVKHANRTVAAMYADRGASLGIVTFSDTAQVVLPVKKMDTATLTEAERAIAGMRPTGCTNMWAGLQQALKQAAAVAVAKPNAFINIIFLTDGEPTADYLPRIGLVEALKKQLPSKNITISCFGFGYSLDAKLLQELSTVGNGTYGYLPDCSMVGSVSINAAAAALSTVATGVQVGGQWVGNLQAGGKRIIPFAGLKAGKMLEVGWVGGGKGSVTVEMASQEESDNATAVTKVLATLLAAANSSQLNPDSLTAVENLVGWLGDDDAANQFLTALKQDIKHSDDHKGQLTKALKSAEWYGSWGLNHLISYSRALALQQCVNFKDAALQHFATDLFRRIQDKGNDLFDNLPAPSPSCSYNSSYAGGISAPMNMAGFNTAQGGCWAGWCKVQMDDGRWKLTHELKPGDSVLGGHRIRCVVRTRHTGPVRMMTGDSLAITPWHPVRLAFANNPEWMFPCERADLLELEDTNEFHHYVYNLVLESGHYVRIENYDVCTLGHYFTDNNVIQHPYFGTRAVLVDLMSKDGWQDGYITLNPQEQQRDANGLVCRV